MKSKGWLWKCLTVVLALALLTFALLYLPASGKPLGIAKRFYTEGIIRQIENDMELTGEDAVILYRDGALASFEIKSHESAEVLYACINRASYLFDMTHTVCEPQLLPVKICEGNYCNFSSLSYLHPATGRRIEFVFSEEDAAAFEAYVMSVVAEKTAEGKAAYYEE